MLRDFRFKVSSFLLWCQPDVTVFQTAICDSGWVLLCEKLLCFNLSSVMSVKSCLRLPSVVSVNRRPTSGRSITFTSTGPVSIHKKQNQINNITGDSYNLPLTKIYKNNSKLLVEKQISRSIKRGLFAYKLWVCVQTFSVTQTLWV